MPVFLKRRQDILPAGYTRLAYIETNGINFGKTGYLANLNTNLTIETDYKPSEAGDFLFGKRDSGRGSNFSIAGHKNKMRFDFGLDTKTMAYQPSGWYTLEIKPGPYPEAPSGWRTLVLINGQVQDDATITYPQLDANYELYIAACNTGGSVSGMAEPGSKIGKIVIRESGEIVRNYIPCKRLSDDMPGWWDTVTKTYMDF